MNFFLDNNLAPGLARALALIAGDQGHAFMHMIDLFPSGDPGDTDWIPALAAKPGNWMALSGDRRIYSTPQNRQALADSGLVVFFLPAGLPRLDRWQQASHLFSWFPKIVERARHAKPRDAYNVQMNGKIERKTS